MLQLIDITEQFPALSNYTYFNTASNGLISADLVAWRVSHDTKLLRGGSEFRDLHKPHIESIRNTVSRFFDAKTTEVALVPNFSFGLNTFIEGLSRNQKVLLLQDDYPSINWAFEHRDFDVCYATIDANLENNIELAVEKYRPTIFAFSLVQYLNGIKIDLDFLKRLKAYHPNLLLVADGTQYLGTEPFSFSESALDVLGCSSYKWLLSGYGNGIFMVKEAEQNKIFPSTIGFNSAEGFHSTISDTAKMKHFEPGHQDTLNYGSLEQSLLCLEKLSITVVSERIKKIATLARSQFEKKGLLEDSVIDREHHSSIFNIKGDEALYGKLKKNNIITSLRGNGIRVSMHYYNTQEDFEKLNELL